MPSATLPAPSARSRVPREIDPQAADGWNNLALTQLALGRLGDARVSAQRAVALGGPRAARYRETLDAIERRHPS